MKEILEMLKRLHMLQFKEYKKTQKKLVKPSDNNKNGLTALNTTDGLTSVMVQVAQQIVYQRQIVQVPVPLQV